ncbi:MAG: DUF86 domain-containing protein [Ideonella sp.]|nr:DUF86 domain-containing protein [Ideonella sp.]MCC7459623.1 DUF86 domain-containing protein [Nitrospira sp.]
MTNRLPKHLHDALTAARRATEFLGVLDLDSYRANALVRSAVERQLEILGEAGKRALDEESALRSRIPDLELAIGLRNRLIHGYDRVLHGVVVDTVRRDLPRLIEALESELKRFPLE